MKQIYATVRNSVEIDLLTEEKYLHFSSEKKTLKKRLKARNEYQIIFLFPSSCFNLLPFSCLRGGSFFIHFFAYFKNKFIGYLNLDVVFCLKFCKLYFQYLPENPKNWQRVRSKT